jgi:hypothetical protein
MDPIDWRGVKDSIVQISSIAGLPNRPVCRFHGRLSKTPYAPSDKSDMKLDSDPHPTKPQSPIAIVAAEEEGC